MRRLKKLMRRLRTLRKKKNHTRKNTKRYKCTRRRGGTYRDKTTDNLNGISITPYATIDTEFGPMNLKEFHDYKINKDIQVQDYP